MEWTNIVVAALALLGTAVGSYSGLKITAYRVEQLEKKVDEHNSFALRLPVIEEKIEVANKRIKNLEEFCGK